MSIIIYIDTHRNTWYTHGKSTHQPTYIPTPMTMGIPTLLPTDNATVVALALAAQEPDFGHSLALWPDLPQNMQSPWSNLCFRSLGGELPILPDLLLFRLNDKGVDWESLKEDFLSDLPNDAQLVSPLEDLVWQVTSSLCSQ